MYLPDLIAVEAVEERFRALTHQPSGEPFSEDGKARWPADQFTFRLIQEGAIRRVQDAPEDLGADPKPEAAPVAAPATIKGK
ncbi:hypothetical protein [Methylobacterium dankookense]|uniref:Uncharacterized protein n=1 Tax=Methylobacterium dankookense TaxID=560405 RepID=A0A564G6I0_9HYPH|nr:hypothetical protein [Methylobacterium dankookense]GJD58359.1 hypothetical protein IFDJLNFL_4278 [Methylobacterium dankookense]VUF15636.1 hypothetical protein MTDSW087_05380 [Methylobacterium dankookense]